MGIDMTAELGIWLFAVGFLAAGAALTLLAWLQARHARLGPGLFSETEAGAVFLFDGEDMLDASDSARALLATIRDGTAPWQRLLGYLIPRFPGLIEDLGRLPDAGRIAMTSAAADGVSFLAEWRGGLTRITLVESAANGQAAQVDTLAQRAQGAELDELRAITDAAPFPIWREGGDGTILWANPAYVALADRIAPSGEAKAWPLPKVFPANAAGRTRLVLPGLPAPLWFDCQATVSASGRLVHAAPADATVKAEDALRAFVQTLTKTFADLPIGLAIFDSDRRLQLFNPALTDLTGLPVGFLSARPRIFALFDAMRERGTLPEPKDYKAWRARMAALETSAQGGDYEETWELTSGATYRVVGRPHAEGALALLFNDITDEISRARRFRADLELGQSVIESTDEAVAVLSSAGVLVMSNAAYARLWNHDPAAEIMDQSISDLVCRWRDGSAPSQVWPMVESYALSHGRREATAAQTRLKDGRTVICRLAPLSGGATLIGFRTEPAVDTIGALPGATARRRASGRSA
jgi:PAS domain-containing protein